MVATERQPELGRRLSVAGPFVAVLLSALLAFSPSWAIDGVRIGDCWTDHDGTNHCGDDANDTFDDTQTPEVGTRHPSNPDLIRVPGGWQPTPGNVWASSDPNDLTTAPAPYGSGHPDYDNVFWDGAGWKASPGYGWVTNDPNDLRTAPLPPGVGHPDYPNIVWDGSSWLALDGYTWNSDDPDDLSTRPLNVGESHQLNPNVVWNGRFWVPASGHTWVSADEDDIATRPLHVGEEHPAVPNTFWTGDSWAPGEGYTWASDDPDSLAVVPATAAQESASLPEDQGLRLVAVPSPSGYQSDAEHRARLAQLSDQHIDRELERINAQLRRMQSQFAASGGDIKGWLIEAEEAEFDALKDSFGLLLGGSLERFEVWRQYPRLASLAKEGWSLAGKIEGLIEAGADPADIANHRELMRDKMLAAYELLHEQGRALAYNTTSKSIEFGRFLVDYSYHVTRWTLARHQINTINDNLGNPNGQLQAQRALSQLQEDLIAEKKRREGSQ
ncbi:MAG: hypothetical protein RIC16_00560 [Rhodospirillales bacterium]